ncbi:histidine kinase [soil metagenome]
MRLLLKYKIDHVLFWTATIVFFAFTTIDVLQRTSVFQYVLNIVIRNGLLILACYANIYRLFPKYFKKGKFALYGFLVLLCLLLYTGLKNVHDQWLYGYIIGVADKKYFFSNTFYNFSIGFFYMTFTLALILSKNWYKQQQLLKKIMIENLETELRYLKAQLNPHFLFNSINSIYFLIDKDNTIARQSLQKFSELLRYQLYEGNEDQIAIEQEIAYLESYIDLQRLRKKTEYAIDFYKEENVKGFTIAPLLMITFVENAFKHVSNYTHQVNSIHVKLCRQDDHLHFSVINTKSKKHTGDDKKQIGLKNVKRRLELLYNNRYKLNITEEPNLYTVQLTLKIV